MPKYQYPIRKVDHVALAASSEPTIWGTYVNSGKPLPSTYPNNRHLFPDPPLNQGTLGSCSGFGTTQFRAALLQQAGGQYVEFSELAQYYMERQLERTINQDAGSSVADGIKVLEQYGVQFADEDPYGTDYQLRFKDAPSGPWFKQLALSPDQVKYINQDANFLANLLDALAQGLVVTVGIEVFSGLESTSCAQTGVLPMPAQGEQSLGGHWVNLFGAEVTDFAKRDGFVWAMNQWGNWGINGAFKMPLAYAEQYIMDAVVGYHDATLPQYPNDPGPQPQVKHTYTISAYWDKPQYTVGDTGFFGCYITQDGKPLNTMNLPVYPMVKLSDGENGPVPTDDTGKGSVPWSADKPGTYTATASFLLPDNTTITSAPASCIWVAKAPQPIPTPPKPNPQPAPPSTVNGVDVSRFQGPINWQALAKSIEYAFVKAVDGRTPVDPNFVTNYSALKSIGKTRGAYQIGYPQYETGPQAYAVYKALIESNGGFELPPTLDIEEASCAGQTNAQVTTFAVEWLTQAIVDYGRAILYSDEAFFSSHIDLTKLPKGTLLWAANYSQEPNLPYTFWQRSNSATEPGISGNVDTDVFKGTLTDLQALCVGGEKVQHTKVVVNGHEFDAVVDNGNTYILWTCLETVPGFKESKVGNEFHFDTATGVDPAKVQKAQGFMQNALDALK